MKSVGFKQKNSTKKIMAANQSIIEFVEVMLSRHKDSNSLNDDELNGLGQIKVHIENLNSVLLKSVK